MFHARGGGAKSVWSGIGPTKDVGGFRLGGWVHVWVGAPEEDVWLVFLALALSLAVAVRQPSGGPMDGIVIPRGVLPVAPAHGG